MNNIIKPFIDTSVLDQSKGYIEYLVEKKALPKGIENAGQGVMILLAGHDYGLSATQALSGLTMINGIITVYGRVASSMMKVAGYDWHFDELEIVKETDAENKEVVKDVIQKMEIRLGDRDTAKRKETFSYSLKEAIKAGQYEEKNAAWTNHLKRMLKWKCLAQARDFFCPEIFSGVAMYEDYKGGLAEGQIIDADDNSLEKRIEQTTTIEDLDALIPEIKKLEGELAQQMLASYAKKKREIEKVEQEKTAQKSHTVDVSEVKTEETDSKTDNVPAETKDVVIDENPTDEIKELETILAPSKDERIAEINERVKQINEKLGEVAQDSTEFTELYVERESLDRELKELTADAQ